jgi:Uncharacterised nucleotidyltransferase
MVGDVEQILRALNAASVRYLVVGGVAVVLHGHLRTTKDLDLVIQLEPGNVRRAIAALESLGYAPVAPVPGEQFADPTQRAAWIRDKHMTVFSLWRDASPAVDLFVEEPFDFDAVYARSVRTPLRRTFTQVVAVADLIAMKRQANRAQDHADIEALTQLDHTEPRA